MAAVTIDGQPASLSDAIAEAARLLGHARLPVVAGLGADIAGARAAILLAERLGGALDHMAADAVLNNLSAMRDSGWMIVSPGEVRRRADLLMLVGPTLKKAWADLAPYVTAPARKPAMVCLGCTGLARELAGEGLTVQAIDARLQDLPAVLAGLRAAAVGHPFSAGAARHKQLLNAAAALKAARFGVAIWSGADLDGLTVEMLSGLVQDLNVATRFSGLPLAAADNGSGVAQAAGWMTGFPMRTGFTPQGPDHDPWRFDAARLLDAGEADAAVWISSYRPAAPQWRAAVPLIALCAPGTRFAQPPHVGFEVGRPGADHDGVDYSERTGALIAVTATRPSNLPSTATILNLVAAALPAPAGAT